MRKIFPLILMIICLTSSCNSDKRSNDVVNGYLKENFDYKIRLLNTYRSNYIQLKSDQPIKYNSSELESLYDLYTSIIKSIDIKLENSSHKIDDLYDLSFELISKSKKFVNDRLDYSIQTNKDFRFDEIKSPKMKLLILKNEITIAMSYAFEFHISRNYEGCGMRKIEVKATTGLIENNQIKINLSCDFLYPEKRKQKIIVNSMQRNGKESKPPFFTLDNYNFGDIVIDSLDQGNYTLNGSVIYYSRDGEIELPFQTSFDVD